VDTGSREGKRVIVDKAPALEHFKFRASPREIGALRLLGLRS